jgi:hypothetical protein
LIAFKRKEQFDDVRAIFGKLVGSAIAAKDHVFWHGVPDLGSMVGFHVPERMGSITGKLKLTTRSDVPRGNTRWKQSFDDVG